MAYIDGFVVPVPKDKLEDYRKASALAESVWREHGALDYREWVEDDVPNGEVTSFPLSVKRREDELVAFSWITYQSRAHRDEVNAKAMKDPRMQSDPSTWPFDGKRMIYGGFAPLLPE